MQKVEKQPLLKKKTEEDGEEIEETEEERKNRRTTLQEEALKLIQKKADFLPKSIDIRLLDGNLYLYQKLDRNVKTIIQTQNDARLMENLLRSINNRVNIYCDNFTLKTGLLMKIVCDLLLKFASKLKNILESYVKIREFIVRYLKYGDGELKAIEGIEEKSEEMNELYKEINQSYKDFIGNIGSLENRVISEYKKLMSNKDYQDTLEKIEMTKKQFSSTFSVTMRWIHDNEDIYANFDVNKSLFLIENRICSYMKVFRKYFDKKVINPVYGINKELEFMVKKFHSVMKTKFIKFDELGSKIFKNWEKKETIYNEGGFLDKRESKLANFYEIISPSYKKYLKKKLKMGQNKVLKNEDFFDFFEYYYDIKYTAESPLVVTFLKCETISNHQQNNIPAILCLDVKILINCFHFRFLET